MGLLDLTSDQSDSLLDFGTGLLSAGGASRMPVSLGQAFGQGMGAMRQGDQQRTHKKLQSGQLEMQQMQFAQARQAQQYAEQQRKMLAQILPTLSPDLQQGYQMGVPPEKIFEAMQSQKDSEAFSSFLGGGKSQPAPRPYQGAVSESLDAMPDVRIQADTPEQRAGIQRNYELTKTKYPQEAERLREQLVQQGIITPQEQQPTAPTPEQIGAYGASRAVSGRKGGDEIMKYAALVQPNVKVLDNGGSQSMYNANSGNFLGSPIQKGMSPDAAASNQLGWANNATANFIANKPTYHDGALVSPRGEITKTPMYAPPKGTPEATAQASAKVLPLIEESDKLLTGSTGSYIGAGADAAAGAFGVSTKGAQSAAKLKALEGALMMAQPRMEGPQSDKDVALYRQMAGQIGDSTVPVETRRAALMGVKAMHEKYSASQASPQSAMSGGGWSATVVK